jgi:NNP family nitrate/nitrite transporter-like MFS transporter
MTSLYIMTFGSFSGFSATFPLLIKELFGDFENAPDPLTYAFLGPLVGSAARVAAGPLSDRFGGGRLTQVSGIGLLASAVAGAFFVQPASTDGFPAFVACMLGLFLFAGIGNASTFKQIPMIFPPRRAGGVIGWTAAIAAYGPFIFSVLIGAVIAAAGDPVPFFVGAAVFYALNIAINWWYYARRGAEKPC